jgi:hypothetical protein
MSQRGLDGIETILKNVPLLKDLDAQQLAIAKQVLLIIWTIYPHSHRSYAFSPIS